MLSPVRASGGARLLLVLLALFGCGAEPLDVGDAADLGPQSAPNPVRHLDPPTAATPAHPYNIILISVDTLRADALSAYGRVQGTSPAVDALAAESILFEEAYSHSPKTAESHMSLFTSIYPEGHRVVNGNARDATRLSDDIPTLAAILKASGYRTAGFVASVNINARYGFDQGFEVYEHHARDDDPELRGLRTFHQAARHLADRKDRDAPFFLFLHSIETHDPYTPPAEFRDLFVDPEYSGDIVDDLGELVRLGGEDWASRHAFYWDRVDRTRPEDLRHLRDLYHASVRYTDHHLGRFLDRVRELESMNDTLILLTSDHGEEFLEHGAFLHNSLFREVLHVPLVLKLPAGLHPELAGTRIGARVRHVDVLPTLLELVGLPAPAHARGESLVKLFAEPATRDREVFAQWHETRSSSLRVGDWSYIQRRGQTPRLYHLASDPLETHDVAATRVGVAERVGARVAGVRDASRSVWQVAASGRPLVLEADVREQLEALGYITHRGN